MLLIKWTILIAILCFSTMLGKAFANQYKDREKELKQVRSAFNMLKTKISYTYEPLPQIFLEMGTDFEGEIGHLFQLASIKMKELSAGEAWKYSLEHVRTNLKAEDKKVLENLENLLGRTSIEGQLSEIELIEQFLEKQIEIAEEERRKNEKLYRSLGIMAGAMIAIILI